MDGQPKSLKETLKSLLSSVDKKLTEIDDKISVAPFWAMGGMDFRPFRKNQQTKMLDYSFYSESDFYSKLSQEKRFLMYGAMIDALCFMLEHSGIDSSMIPADNSEYPTITIFPLPEQETTLFLITDSFRYANKILTPHSIYRVGGKDITPTDMAVSEYMTNSAFRVLKIDSSNPPSNDAIILAYNYIRYHAKHSIFVFLDDDFNYTGQAYPKEGVVAFKQHLSNTLGLIGTHDTLDSLEITTYDIYTKTICPEKTVDFFLSRLKNCAQSHILAMDNIGTALQNRREKIIDRYIAASNLSVKTMYYYNAKTASKNPHFQTIDIIARYRNPLYNTLFEEISSRATANLKLLHSDRIFSAMVTSEWLYSNFGQTQGLDNTFICAGYFKFVELLLTEILTSDYKGSYIYLPKGPQAIDDNEKWLMLGNMFQFISFDKNSPISSSPYQSLMREAFENWTKHVRNGYFHKDILSAEEVITIRNKTFEVVYMILGTLPK